MNRERIIWHQLLDAPEFRGPRDWIYEAQYRGLRISCGYNDGGPVAWVGHPTEDRWIDSIACDGTFESGAKRAAELADEIMLNTEMRVCLTVKTEGK